MEASDGLERWELFQRHSEEIRLAVVDWVMPGIDGVELCRRVRSSASEQYVYVVLLSAKQDKKRGTSSQVLRQGPTITSASPSNPRS